MNVASRPAVALSAVPAAPAAAGAADLPEGARLALALQAAVLECATADEAAAALARALARRLGVARASVALVQAGVPRLVADSDGACPAPDTPAHALRLAALEEALDQVARVRWPEAPAPGEPPRVTRAHRALARAGSGATTGVALVARGRPIGALCLEHAADAPPDAQALEHAACLVAPALAWMQEAEAPAWHRLARAWRGIGDAGRRRWIVAGAGLLVLAMGWPVDRVVGGQARLEGAVQRVVAVPADGFLGQVHARPGDRVPAGQPLVDLADQDWQLERERGLSQIAQHRDALAAANARADRSQLVQLQARLDEAQAQVELVEERLARARLTAPFDAIVVRGDLSQRLGAPVRQGEELMTLAPLQGLRVVVEVDERDIAAVRAGQAGELSLTALPWQALALTVVRVAPAARAVEGRNVFDVEASLAQPPEDLRPGLQGSARLVTGRTVVAWRWARRAVESVRRGWWSWFG